jgi:hypothetical protein
VWLESRRHGIKVSLVDKASAIMASQTADWFGQQRAGQGSDSTSKRPNRCIKEVLGYP